MISMQDALPAMPEFYAAEHFAAKIRHGQTLTAEDLSDRQDVRDAGQPYIKIVDRKGNLIAVVAHHASGDTLAILLCVC